jgi:starvation-inducible DNA-binding protein
MHHRSSVALDEKTRDQLVELLNGLVADSVDLFTQIKHAHWNVKGRHFISLHELFDEVAEHARKHSDLLAERVAILGGFAKGTARMAAKGSSLPEIETDDVSGEAFVRALVSQFARSGKALREAIEQAGDKLADPITEDLLIEVLRQQEMDTWFLESHLEQPDRAAKSPPAPGHRAGRGEGAPAH